MSPKLSVIKYIIKGINPSVAYCKKTDLYEMSKRRKEGERMCCKISFVKMAVAISPLFLRLLNDDRDNKN